MTKEELINLAVGCGWTHGCGELVRGRWAITIFKRAGIELEGPKRDQRYRLRYDEIQQCCGKSWIIGPFKEGWFSLKANRWVQ